MIRILLLLISFAIGQAKFDQWGWLFSAGWGEPLFELGDFYEGSPAIGAGLHFRYYPEFLGKIQVNTQWFHNDQYETDILSIEGSGGLHWVPAEGALGEWGLGLGLNLIKSLEPVADFQLDDKETEFGHYLSYMPLKYVFGETLQLGFKGIWFSSWSEPRFQHSLKGLLEVRWLSQ